jgi:hypothetical protein
MGGVRRLSDWRNAVVKSKCGNGYVQAVPWGWAIIPDQHWFFHVNAVLMAGA